VKLREGRVVVVKGSEKKNMFPADLVLRVEAAWSNKQDPRSNNLRCCIRSTLLLAITSLNKTIFTNLDFVGAVSEFAPFLKEKEILLPYKKNMFETVRKVLRWLC